MKIQNGHPISKPFYIYVDVDETLIRNFGQKRIPMPHVVEHIRQLHQQGAILYCWSSGGEDYARQSAQELGIDQCFVGFLPKPQVMIDDQSVVDWRRLKQIHPNECVDWQLDDYRKAIQGE